MATITPSWSSQSTVINAVSVAGSGGTTSGDIDLATNSYIAAEVQISITHNGSANDGCTVEFLRSNDGGTTDDNISMYSVETDHTANYIRTFTFSDLTFFAVKVTNNDTAGVGNATVTAAYKGLQYSSA